MAPKKDGKKPMQPNTNKEEDNKKRVADLLDDLPDADPSSNKFKKHKSAVKKLEYSVKRTKHASTGRAGQR